MKDFASWYSDLVEDLGRDGDEQSTRSPKEVDTIDLYVNPPADAKILRLENNKIMFRHLCVDEVRILIDLYLDRHHREQFEQYVLVNDSIATRETFSLTLHRNDLMI